MKNLTILTILLLTSLVMVAQPVYRSSVTNTGATGNASVTKPVSTAIGDLLVVGLAYEKGSSEIITMPAGWTLIRRTDNTTNIGMATYYKIATAAEPTSYVFGLANGSKWSIGISRITSVNAANPIDISNGSTGFGNAVATPSLTTSGANRFVLSFYTNKKASTYTPAVGTTERYDAPNTASGMPSNMMASFNSGAGATAPGVATASDIEYWSALQIAVNPSVSTLPVKFTSFTVIKNNIDYEVQWSTSEEWNSAYYEVERSEEGISWKTVARINAAGNSSTAKYYSHSDRNVAFKKLQYRVKQVDLDGKMTYTAIKSFTNNSLAPLYIYANQGSVTIRFSEEMKGTVELNMVSMSGQLVKTEMVTNPSGEHVMYAPAVKGHFVITVRSSQGLKAAQQVIL